MKFLFGVLEYLECIFAAPFDPWVLKGYHGGSIIAKQLDTIQIQCWKQHISLMSILDILFNFRKQMDVMENESWVEEHDGPELAWFIIDAFEVFVVGLDVEH